MEWREGFQKRHLKFQPSVYGWEGMCLSVCLTFRESWIIFDGNNGSWLNFQDLSNSIKVIIGWGFQISLPKVFGYWRNTDFFFKICLLPEFLFYGNMTYLFENLRTGAKEIGWRICILGRHLNSGYIGNLCVCVELCVLKYNRPHPLTKNQIR